jgi:hypothetical protein
MALIGHLHARAVEAAAGVPGRCVTTAEDARELSPTHTERLKTVQIQVSPAPKRDPAAPD